MVTMSFPEMEATFALEMDRIKRLSAENPLEGLAQLITVMQQVNVELMKAMAPALMNNAQQKTDAYLKDGRIHEDRREGSRTLVSFLRVQESTVKLGVALVKVQDEKSRRTAR
jgi:hypothetical protein